ncbi:hypothetical protein D3C76_1261850 [compost metagenome]
MDEVTAPQRSQHHQNDRVPENRPAHIPQLVAGEIPPVIVQQGGNEQQQEPFRLKLQRKPVEDQRDDDPEGDLGKRRWDQRDIVADDVRGHQTDEQHNNGDQ